MKKKLFVMLMVVGCVFLIGCSNKNDAPVEGSLNEIVEKLYEGLEDELPMAVKSTNLTSETIENYAFVKDVNFKEAIVSESMVGSIPFSVVLIRLNDANGANEIVSNIKANANPRKWICVEAENVIVESRGDLVILIMCNELATKIETNFNNL